jgi:hypothetical protein
MSRTVVSGHWWRGGALAIAVSCLAAGAAAAAPSAKTGAAQAGAPAVSNGLKFNPGMSASALAGRPDTDLLELSNGRTVPLGQIRRLSAIVRRGRASQAGEDLAVLRMKPAATGVPIRGAGDLMDALKNRGNGETLQFPSGFVATVGQVRLAQPLVEEQLGRRLETTAGQRNLSGPVVKVPSWPTRAQWVEIFQKPDNTLLESPKGARISVGELKKALAADGRPAKRSGKGRGAPAAPSAPVQSGRPR